MMIFSIGEWAAGLPEAIAVLIAFFGPTALLAFIVARGWKKLEKWPWRTFIQHGLAPVSIGLLLAGCFTMAKGAISGLETAAIAVGVLLILLQYKINPALLVLGGAVNRAAVVFPQMMDGNAPKDFRRAPAVPYGSTIPLSERPPAP